MFARTAWRIGRVAGIEIQIDTSWLIIFAMVLVVLSGTYFPAEYPGWSLPLYWFLGIVSSLLFFSSVLAHELGHSIVANRQGEEVRSITLFLFGGMAQISGEPDEPRKEFVMALAGPLVSFAIGVICLGIWRGTRGSSVEVSAVARWLMEMNFALGVFNLVPGYPLDGGRLLRSFLWRVTHDQRKATRAASRVGQGFAILLIAGGVLILVDSVRHGRASLNGVWLVFIGWFLHGAATRGYEQVLVRELLRRTRVDHIMSPNVPWVPAAVTLQELVHGYVLAGRGRAFLVGDGGVPLGIVCLSDAKKVPTTEWGTTPVARVMTPAAEVQVARPEDTLDHVLARMSAHDCGQVPVVDSGRVVGLLSRYDILEHFRTKSELGV